MTTVDTSHADIVADVTENMGQQVWGKKDITRLEIIMEMLGRGEKKCLTIIVTPVSQIVPNLIST